MMEFVNRIGPRQVPAPNPTQMEPTGNVMGCLPFRDRIPRGVIPEKKLIIFKKNARFKRR